MQRGARSPLDAVYAGIERYYTRKVVTHGPTPLGVDWTCEPTQELRFVQLMKVCDLTGPLSLNDIGCGYGALLAFLRKRHAGSKVAYLGVDLSAAMISEARRLWAGWPEAEFAVGHAAHRQADYSVASGIFNVKLNEPLPLWTQFVETTLAEIHGSSRRGFAVNFLSPLAGGATGAPELYRPEPDLWRHYCEDVLGTKVKMLAGYGMREFTLLAQRP